MAREGLDSIIIASVDRALEVLMILHDHPHGLGVSELARKMGVYKSTLFRTLATLEHRGFVKKFPDNSYRLGMTVGALGLGVMEQKRYLDELVSVAKSLSEMWHENVNVSVLARVDDIYKSILVHRETYGLSVLRESQDLGSYTDAHLSAVGKCMLAFTPGIDFGYLKGLTYKKYTVNTIVTPEALQETLERVRQQGYAIDAEERELGLYCVGVPVFSTRGDVVAAISISGVAQRIQSHDQEALIASLKEISVRTRLVVPQ